MLFAIYAAITLLIGFFAIYTIFWYRKKLTLLDLTDEISGTITKITKSNLGTTPGSTTPAQQVKIKYNVNGRSYTTSMQYQGERSFEVGQEAIVLYDPDKPSRAIPKDFKREHAEYYWRMLVILAVILCVIAFCITIFTLPNTLGLSNEEEKKFKIGRNAFFVIAMPIAYHFVRRSESYKAEKKRDPKGTRSAFLGGAALWGKFLIDLIWDIIEMFVF